MHDEFAISVDTLELLETLQSNRAKHEETYKKAVEAWLQECKKAFTDRLVKLDKVDPAEASRQAVGSWHRFQGLVNPVCYVNEYDDAIRMIKAHKEHRIRLSEKRYMAWIEDKWDWSTNFHQYTTSKVG